MYPLHKKPTQALLALCFLCTAIAVACTWAVLLQPWLGIQFTAGEDGSVMIAGSKAPTSPIPAGVRAVRIAAWDGAALDLRASDLIEEPDFFPTYGEKEDFFARQSSLAAILRSGQVRLDWLDAGGAQGTAVITTTRRPLTDLPLVYWFQLLAGFLGLAIGAWIFLLRPQDWGARMFALTGLMFPLATTTAAIYSVRELALPGDLFRTLSSINHAGSLYFGCALNALFLVYPRRLVSPRTLWWLPAIFSIFFAADVLHVMPGQSQEYFHFALMMEMLLAIAFAVLQWRKSRGQPVDRASLRWFMLSVLVGCSLFIITVPSAITLGLLPPLSQGWSFGFFLFMYAGIALGLARYRLFDLDEWAYRILLWVAGALSVIALDALMIFFGLQQSISLGIALLLTGWLYFPLRQWLWQRIVTSNAVNFESQLPALSNIAFTPEAEEREERWNELLQRMFDPLEIQPAEERRVQAWVRDDGLTLYVPACGGFTQRLLRYAGRGSRLFSSRDALVVQSLCRLMEQVASGREAYQQGVEQERHRIAHDLHDNIGARLLKLIHHLRGSPGADIAREAMKDLRTAIAAIDAPPAALADALADWHAETESRCDVAGVRLAWTQDEDLPALKLPPRTRASIESMLREGVTNALKHAEPQHLHVQVHLHGTVLKLCIENDGQRPQDNPWREGYGLRNIRGRLHELGGELDTSSLPSGARITLTIPLQAQP